MFEERRLNFYTRQLPTSAPIRKTFQRGSAYTSWNMRSDSQSQLTLVPWPPRATLRVIMEEVISETMAGPRFYAYVAL